MRRNLSGRHQNGKVTIASRFELVWGSPRAEGRETQDLDGDIRDEVDGSVTQKLCRSIFTVLMFAYCFNEDSFTVIRT